MRFFQRYVWSNLDLKLASLAIAFALWSAMGNEPVAEVGYDVPLHLRNVPAAMELSSETPAAVQVRVRGPSSALRQLSRADLTVSVDLAGVHSPGERSFTLAPDELPLPLGVQVVRIAPSQVRVRLEERSERAVPVMPRLVGSTARGYRIGRYEVSPEKVPVVGPQSRVNPMEQALTDPIDLTGVIGTTQFWSNVYLPDPLVRLQNPKQVRVTVHMERR